MRIEPQKIEKNIIRISEIACLCVCTYCAIKSIWMNSIGVSLWLDEACLAYNICTRNLLNLTSNIFEWGQIAPVGWLYIVKIITVIFGTTEQVLRLFSVFSYIATMFVAYYFSKKYLKMRFPLIASAFVASMSFSLEYAIMLKPYISDGLFGLLTILVWYMYREKKLNKWAICIIWSILIWFSNPVCFICGGLLLSESIYAIIGEKSIKNLYPMVIIGISILISFVIYYFYWLRPVATSNYMQDFWIDYNFPIFPKSKDDISKAINLMDPILGHFSKLKKAIIPITILSLITSIKNKNRNVLGIILGFVVMLFASYIHMFPVSDRMWYYIYPILSILFFYEIEKFLKLFERIKWPYTKVFTILLFIIIETISIYYNDGLYNFNQREKVYRSGEELNYEIDYLYENIKSNENVYVYYHSVPGFMYKNGYNTSIIKSAGNNIIYGETFFDENSDYIQDINNIVNSENCYIVMSHINESRIEGLKENLVSLGYLELVENQYDTPLLYWTSEEENIKTQINLSVSEKYENDGLIYATIKIYNSGNTILNSVFCPVNLVLVGLGESYEIDKNIKKGEFTQINISYKNSEHPVIVIEDKTGKNICPDTEIQL